VRFADAASRLLEHPEYVLVEVGPGQTLSTLVMQRPERNKAQVVVPSMPPVGEGGEARALLHAVGKLWLTGVEVQTRGFEGERVGRRVVLPTYPFERKRYWVEAERDLVEGGGRQDAGLGPVNGGAVVPLVEGQKVEELIEAQLRVMQAQLEVLHQRSALDS
jgi:acyl transferase domain-containing protein